MRNFLTLNVPRHRSQLRRLLLRLCDCRRDIGITQHRIDVGHFHREVWQTKTLSIEMEEVIVVANLIASWPGALKACARYLELVKVNIRLTIGGNSR